MEARTKINLIGIYLLLSLLILAVIPVIVFFAPIEREIIRILFYVGASGGIGGTLYCIRGFYQNLGENNFQLNWAWWYVFRPVISVIVGVFMYFLVVGGLMSISNSPDVNLKKGVLFYSALSFLSGYSFTRFADKIDDITKTILSKKKSKNE